MSPRKTTDEKKKGLLFSLSLTLKKIPFLSIKEMGSQGLANTLLYETNTMKFVSKNKNINLITSYQQSI